MSKISKNDIKITGKVLQNIGDLLINNPNLLLDFFDSNSNEIVKQDEDSLKINLFQKYKLSEDKDLYTYLKSFSINDLFDIMKFNNIYTTKYKRKDDIIKYIIHIISMQNLDIFINQVHDQSLRIALKKHRLDYDE